MSATEIFISETAAGLATTAAQDLSDRINQLLAQQPSVNLVLTGGTLGIEILSEMSKLQAVDVSRLRIWWGDERFVGLNHPDRNEFQALSAWPELIGAQLNRFPNTESELQQAAELQNNLLEQEFGQLAGSEGSPGEASAVKAFDIVLLGMGPDGHIASLFPGHEALSEGGAWVVAEPDAPKPPSQRLSLTYAALNAAAEVWFLISGSQKSAPAKGAIQDPECQLPAAKVSGKSVTRWYLDREIEL